MKKYRILSRLFAALAILLSDVPLTRGFKIPWRILWGSLRVSGDSAGKEPRCWH